MTVQASRRGSSELLVLCRKTSLQAAAPMTLLQRQQMDVRGFWMLSNMIRNPKKEMAGAFLVMGA